MPCPAWTAMAQIAEHKARRVPDLVGKIARCLDARRRQLGIVARRAAGHQGKAQRVAAVLVDHVERIILAASGSDFEIFLPSSLRTRPCRYTVWKGTSPVNSRPSMIMRATQKKRMS